MVACCVSFVNRHRIAVTDYRTLLVGFDSTRHSYYGYLRRRKVGGRGKCTEFVIVFKETTLGIVGLDTYWPTREKPYCLQGALILLPSRPGLDMMRSDDKKSGGVDNPSLLGSFRATDTF